MRFTYYYKTSDNVRHEAEISAPGRDEAFAALRDRGIRPIKVVAADSQMDGRDSRDGGRNMVAYAFSVALVLLMVGGGVWWLAARQDAAPYQVMTPQGPVNYMVAQPLPRQMIPGNRERIENGKLRMVNGGNGESPSAKVTEDKRGTGHGVFKFAAEALLAQYAEPGRPLPMSQLSHSAQLSISQADFKACLKEPIRIASTDFTEIIDLKRIVTGMKLEMRTYLAGGGTVEQYLAELEKRQRLEISYRENAERRLNEMLATSQPPQISQTSQTLQISQIPQTSQTPQTYREAYSYWLKANAQLQAMGIYPLPLPDVLRTYQMGLELEN